MLYKCYYNNILFTFFFSWDTVMMAVNISGHRTAPKYLLAIEEFQPVL